jgi:hypothetical protein
MLLALPLLGQQAQQMPDAPVPARIISAKTIFISNGGELVNWYHAKQNRTYNQFYAAMKNWGRYEIVSDPGDAGLIFEIRLDEVSRESRLRLVILDPKTRVTLWTVAEFAEATQGDKSMERDYSLAMKALVDEVKKLVSTPDPGGLN